jgi:hypothetical protein
MLDEHDKKTAKIAEIAEQGSLSMAMLLVSLSSASRGELLRQIA